jgi:hypothetical protein
MIAVCLAGATGWAGSELARAIAHADDSARPDRRSARGQGRHACRITGPFDATSRLSDRCRSDLRNARPEAHDPSRFRQQRAALVDGALLAIRKVSTLVGVHRGLDSVLDLRTF